MVSPVIEFVDELLLYIDAYYHHVIEKSIDDDVIEKLNKMSIVMREKEGGVKARVRAINDEYLSKSVDELMGIFGIFILNMAQGKSGEAMKVGREARISAGNVFTYLQPYFDK